ncbi:FAD-dependent oxidoreductase [Marinoscillum sp.]|uniref:FAD-dependent oxidoreductase n=1 Tax=Marinoscillum sp. TaxID=2024838 RepID=UPI003BAA1DBB
MQSVTVVGSGIIGLTAASALREKGFKVRVISKEPLEKSLSFKVGAIWFPFEVHPIHKANEWGARAYERYKLELPVAEGISFIPFMVVYTPESNSKWVQRMPEGTVYKANKHELPSGIRAAYIANVPLAEPHKYLPYLKSRCEKSGVVFEQRTISSLQEMSDLDELVINCTGLGSKELCSDEELIPMRGQILRCLSMNIHSYVNSTKAGQLTYAIQRSEDLIIGGTDYLNDWNEEANKRDAELILDRFRAIGVTDQTPHILEEKVGLRPRRSEVRFEFDSQYSNVFHNYGHGGAGFTVGWGCALELADRY